MTQFNQQLAMEFKDQGIKQVADNNKHFVKVAKNLALALCKKNGTVTCDDVRKICHLEPLHYNAWGSVFRDKRFEFTGRMQPSTNVKGHGNLQRVWRLRSER